MFRATVWTAIALWAGVAAGIEVPDLEPADQFDGQWHVFNLHRVTQRGDGKINDGFYNPSVYGGPGGKKVHPFGQPNSHFPWLHPGGVTGERSRELVVVRSVRWPRDRGPWIYRVKGRLPEHLIAPNDLWSWHFPKGTAFRIELFGGRGRFAVHEVHKLSDAATLDEWDENHTSTGEAPEWYSPPENCRKCHESTGSHAEILEPKSRDYYYWLRGSADGRFSWHPFQWDRTGTEHQEAVIRPALRRFIVDSP